MNGKLTVCNTLLITCGTLKMASNVCGEVNEVREERLRWRRECDRLRRERKQVDILVSKNQALKI